MATKRKTPSTQPQNEAARAAELKAAEAHWQDLKRRARAAKAAAKDAKKAVKRLRNLLASQSKAAARKETTSARRSKSQAKPTTRMTAAQRLRIAGTPEPRVRPKRKKQTLRKLRSDLPSPEVRAGAAAQDTPVLPGRDDGTQ
jgi:membrane-bound lytic murein transglycosylase